MVTFGMKQEDAGSTVPCTRRLRPSRMETMNFKNMPSVGFCYNLFRYEGCTLCIKILNFAGIHGKINICGMRGYDIDGINCKTSGV